MNFAHSLVCLFLAIFCFAIYGGERYIVETPSGKNEVVASADGTMSFAFESPGSALFYRSNDRISFRHSKDIFNASQISMSVTAEGAFTEPVKAWLFVKDKDGAWFQSEKEFQLLPGVQTRLSARIDQPGRNFVPVGHSGVWSASESAAPFEYGVSIWSADESSKIVFTCSSPVFEGRRETPSFAVVDWRTPEKVLKNEMFESRFRLSREYFNPFDPDEIRCDYEIELPGNSSLALNRSFAEQLFLKPQRGYADELTFYKKLNVKPPEKRFNLSYPAFYSQDYERTNHLTREIISPNGSPYWAFRMTPFAVGKMRVRLHITDSSEDKKIDYYSPWREIEVIDSDSRGPIRRGVRDPRYFEYLSGDLFFPVSLNIHANTDRRSEFKFKWGHLPDRGTRDFDDYFNACGSKGGITLIEIWMASWTYAVEWDSARQYYHGVGRYNTANAWKLDRLLDTARANGIYLNLVLDSHGKLSFRSDQEWNDNPMNKKGAFAAANGAILDSPRDYWVDFEAMKMNLRRNRYIAARWGADPNVFAFEFWSEVDLCDDSGNRLHHGYMQAWHRNAARELSSMCQAVRLFATHVCGDCGNTYGWRETTCLPPELTHIAGDAYRSPDFNYVDQTRKQTERLKEFGKPMLVTEYGGTAFGSGESNILGDIHAGLWASFFLGQSGSPALWWHDFVHIRDHYGHYKGFSSFMHAISPAMTSEAVFSERICPRLPYSSLFDNRRSVTSLPKDLKNRFTERFTLKGVPAFFNGAFVAASDGSVFGWCYDKAYMMAYPPDISEAPFINSLLIPLNLSSPGRYTVTFYDTLSGAETYSSQFESSETEIFIAAPPFRIDTAFAVRRIEK